MKTSGRVAVVTGGARGIGAATARRFLLDGFAGVVLVDRNAETLAATQAQMGKLGRVEIVVGDLSDSALRA